MAKHKPKIDRRALLNQLDGRLKFLKERIGFTRAQFARILGISSTHFYKTMKDPAQASEYRFMLIKKWLDEGCPVCGAPLDDRVNQGADHAHEGEKNGKNDP